MRMTPEREEKVRQVERFLKEKIEPILQQDEKANELLHAKELYLSAFNYGWPFYFTREKAEAFAMKHRGLRYNGRQFTSRLFRKETLPQEKVALENYYYVEDCKIKLEQTEERIGVIKKKLGSTLLSVKSIEKLEDELSSLKEKYDKYKKVVDADAEIERHIEENVNYLGESFFNLYREQAKALRRVLKENNTSPEISYLVDDVLDKYKTAEEEVTLYKSAMYSVKQEVNFLIENKIPRQQIKQILINPENKEEEDQENIEENIENE